jgi:hypothetical protein
MSLLSEKPMLKADVLRPLLSKYLPFYTATDSMFLVNFPLQAQNWLVNNGDKEVTMEEARHLSSKWTLASEDFLLKDDHPILKQNLTSLLQKIIEEDSSTWDALCFLDQMKASNPGLDYRVKYDHHGRPEAVCWMLPEMRSDEIRFGNCLFLDSQKRQCNVVGCPYIGPVVKDSEMPVRCVAECICLEESHHMYVWIVSMLADMEQRYNLNFLDLIFEDQGITRKIMVDLDIATTCIVSSVVTTTIKSMRSGLTLSERISLKKSGDTWTECCWGQKKNGTFLTHQPNHFFYMMPRNSLPWNKFTRILPTLPVGSSRQLRVASFSMVLCLQNKNILAWLLIVGL